MQLKVECTWNNKKDKGTQIIRFDHKPQSFFALPTDKIDALQKRLLEVPQIGPPMIKELESLKENYPKSLYINFHLYRVYEFFEYTEEKDNLFNEMKKNFPNELVVKCIEAHNF